MNITDDAMRAAVTKALVETLTTEKRDELIQGAIAKILTEPSNPNSYGRDKSTVLEAAFFSAVRVLAETHAITLLRENAEFNTKLAALFADAARAVFDNEEKRAEVVGAVAGAIKRAMTGERY